MERARCSSTDMGKFMPGMGASGGIGLESLSSGPCSSALTRSSFFFLRYFLNLSCLPLASSTSSLRMPMLGMEGEARSGGRLYSAAVESVQMAECGAVLGQTIPDTRKTGDACTAAQPAIAAAWLHRRGHKIAAILLQNGAN